MPFKLSVSQVRRSLSRSRSRSSSSKIDLDAAVFLRRAHELKEEGNRRFQSKDYAAAMELYEQALKLTPRNHPDRAVFHSNRAACLMQMKPVQYDTVVNECSLALEAHPKFGRALFRRARAFEAMGKFELALQDVQLLLQGDGNHPDALELAKRLRVALGNREEAQQDLQGRPATPVAASYAGTSPAALGASVVRGSPVTGRGPCLPGRPLPKKKGGKPEQQYVKVGSSDARQNGVSAPPSPALETPDPRTLDSYKQVPRTPVLAKESVQGKSTTPTSIDTGDRPSPGPAEKSLQRKTVQIFKPRNSAPLQFRPLKLIYDHDIRLSQMLVGCKFGDLRELVKKRFPSSKAVLIKYKDMEGDLVTITSTEELRLAEAAAAVEAARNKLSVAGTSSPDGAENSLSYKEHQESAIEVPSTVLRPLRLYVVEVPAEQEPTVQEEDHLMDAVTKEIDQRTEESLSAGDAEIEDFTNVGLKKTEDSKVSLVGKVEKADEGQLNGKEIEIDEWLLDFAHLFRMHLGIDPDGHVDLHDLGMELCSEALEETVTSEEAQQLFEQAACKFQEVAALAFFNWGNVHMCAARKRIPLDDYSNKPELLDRLQAAFDWAQAQYVLAEKKYEEALHVKSDFYEGILALGQEKFESAKLRWSLAVASQVDLSTWDSSETLELFDSAEQKMQIAAEMWEKLEERRIKEVKTSGAVKRDSMKADSRGHGDAPHELTEAETLEQFAAMRSQINLFWGNILFEHSQVTFRLGLLSWKQLLDAAVQKFEKAGASPSDIMTVLKKHISNPSASQESTSADHHECAHVHKEAAQVQDRVKDLDSMDTLTSPVMRKAHACDEKFVCVDNVSVETTLENGSV